VIPIILKKDDMKKTTHLIFAGLLMIMLIIFSSCQRGNSVAEIPAVSISESTTTSIIDPKTPEITIPDNIIEKVIEANKELSSYEFRMDTVQNIKDSVKDMTFITKQSGALDNLNEKRKVEIELTANGTGMDDDLAGKSLIYFIGKDAYFGGVSENGQSSSWSKNLYDKGERDQIASVLDKVQLQLYVLEKSTLKTVELEESQGIPCYLIEINPDNSSLRDYFNWEIDLPSGAQSIKLASVQYWVTQQDLLLNKGYLRLDLERTDRKPENTSMEISIVFDKINQPVDIQLPAEASLSTSNR
jgi:hypothetical protein